MRACPPNPVPGITAKAAWVMYVLLRCPAHMMVARTAKVSRNLTPPLFAQQCINPVAALSVDILEDEATEAAAFYGILKPSLDPASHRHHANI